MIISPRVPSVMSGRGGFNHRAETGAEAPFPSERARRAGATIVTEPGQRPWGYAGAFTDPDGHLWMVTTHP